MKRFLPFFCLILLAACSTEKSVDPAKASTFLRYFNGGNNDEAKAIVVTPDNGFVILATTEIKNADLSNSRYKIKLIKTDPFGNQVWQRLYPEFTSDPTTEKSYRGFALINLADGGYAIAGDDIQPDGSPKLMMMTTDADGNNPVFKTATTTSSVSGRGLTVSSSGNFLVLGSVPGETQVNNMVLCEFKKTSLDQVWSNAFGAGVVTLSNRIFLDSKSNAFWGGTLTRNNSTTSIRLIKVVTAETNKGGIDFDLPITLPGRSETGNDLCRFGSGFAIVGSTDSKVAGGTGDNDILFKRLTEDGNELYSISFPLKEMEPTLETEQNDVGNAICATRDGGFILLGTVDSQANFGRGDKDLYIIKIDAFGNRAWSKSYGSKFEDLGVNVVQADDGGYVILATTNLSKVKTVMMLKVDADGAIE